MNAIINKIDNRVNIRLYVNKPFSSQFTVRLSLQNQKPERKIIYSVPRTTSKSI